MQLYNIIVPSYIKEKSMDTCTSRHALKKVSKVKNI